MMKGDRGRIKCTPIKVPQLSCVCVHAPICVCVQVWTTGQILVYEI